MANVRNRLNPSEAVHADVEQSDVRLVSVRHIDCLPAGSSLGDDLKIGVASQQLTQTLPEFWVVVGE